MREVVVVLVLQQLAIVLVVEKGQFVVQSLD